MQRAAIQICRPTLLRIFVVVNCCLFFMSACGEPELGPKEQLRQWVEQGQTAAEAKERRDLVDMISPAYLDANGNDRDDIGNLFRLVFLRQNKIQLLTSIEEIRVFGDSAAEIDLNVGMAGTKEGAFGFSADAYQFELELERDGDDWSLISARWGELGGELR
jgi:hypothetical protein